MLQRVIREVSAMVLGAVREGGAVETALGDKLREFQNEDNKRLTEGAAAASGVPAAAGGGDAGVARGQAAL